jgi:hypothetical protein
LRKSWWLSCLIYKKFEIKLLFKTDWTTRINTSKLKTISIFINFYSNHYFNLYQIYEMTILFSSSAMSKTIFKIRWLILFLIIYHLFNFTNCLVKFKSKNIYFLKCFDMITLDDIIFKLNLFILQLWNHYTNLTTKFKNKEINISIIIK